MSPAYFNYFPLTSLISTTTKQNSIELSPNTVHFAFSLILAHSSFSFNWKFIRFFCSLLLFVQIWIICKTVIMCSRAHILSSLLRKTLNKYRRLYHIYVLQLIIVTQQQKNGWNEERASKRRENKIWNNKTKRNHVFTRI